VLVGVCVCVLVGWLVDPGHCGCTYACVLVGWLVG
jgi:hypothetical protein